MSAALERMAARRRRATEIFTIVRNLCDRELAAVTTPTDETVEGTYLRAAAQFLAASARQLELLADEICPRVEIVPRDEPKKDDDFSFFGILKRIEDHNKGVPR